MCAQGMRDPCGCYCMCLRVCLCGRGRLWRMAPGGVRVLGRCFGSCLCLRVCFVGPHPLLTACLCAGGTACQCVQGTYVYFDFNIVHDDLQTGWCYRRKENFTFR